MTAGVNVRCKKNSEELKEFNAGQKEKSGSLKTTFASIFSILEEKAGSKDKNTPNIAPQNNHQNIAPQFITFA